MKVTLVAWTQPVKGEPIFLSYLAYKVSTGKVREDVKLVLAKMEMDKKSKEKVKRIIFDAARNYPSILEHMSFTFLVEGISRTCSHQLVRHRIASYTQESQRYSIPIDEDQIDNIRMVILRRLEELRRPDRKAWIYNSVGNKEFEEHARGFLDRMMGFVEYHFFVIPESIKRDVIAYYEYSISLLECLEKYFAMIKYGVPYEDARFTLPQAVKTKILVTVNLRELLHIACLRLSCKAQWEIRRVVKLMIDEAQKVIPYIWDLVKKTCKGELLCLEA